MYIDMTIEKTLFDLWLDEISAALPPVQMTFANRRRETARRTGAPRYYEYRGFSVSSGYFFGRIFPGNNRFATITYPVRTGLDEARENKPKTRIKLLI